MRILLFWCGWPGMPKVPKVTKLQNLGKKEVRHKFNFLHEDKNQSFLEAGTIVFDYHNQSTQNNKSLQYFCNISRKKVGLNLIFLYADKRTFLQVDTINIGEYG